MNAIKQEVTFEVEGQDGQPVALRVRPVNPAMWRQIQRAGRRAYCEAIRAGHPPDAQAGPDHFPLGGDESCRELREGLWAAAAQLERADLSLAERHGIARAMRENRTRLRAASATAAQRAPTADSVAAQAQFEVLVALCVHSARGDRLFRSAEDYRRRAGEPFGYRVAEAVARTLPWLDYAEPPEERFLREHGLAA